MRKDYCLLGILYVLIREILLRKIRINLKALLSEDFTKYQYIDGTRNPDRISPDTRNMDQFVLDHPGNFFMITETTLNSILA